MKRIALFLTLTLLSGCAVMQKAVRSYPLHGFEDLVRIQKNPEAHADELYAFSGEVLWIREDLDTGATFQLYVEGFGSRAEGSTVLVEYPVRGGTVILEGHKVYVLGHPGKSHVYGTNTFGGTISTVPFTAVAYFDLTAGQTGWLLEQEDLYRAWSEGRMYKSPWGLKVREDETRTARK